MESQHYVKSHNAYVRGMMNVWMERRMAHIFQHKKDVEARQRLTRDYLAEVERLRNTQGSYQLPTHVKHVLSPESAVSASAIELAKAATKVG